MRVIASAPHPSTRFGMSLHLRQPALPLSFLLLTAGLSGLGCAEPLEPAPAAQLRESFPQQAAQVLAAGDGFASTERGFQRATTTVAARGLDVELPREGEGEIHLRLAGGADVRV